MFTSFEHTELRKAVINPNKTYKTTSSLTCAIPLLETAKDGLSSAHVEVNKEKID